MTPWQRIAVAAIGIAALLFAWLFRYEITVVPAAENNGGWAYLLDRWTGAVHIVYTSGRREIRPVPPPQ